LVQYAGCLMVQSGLDLLLAIPPGRGRSSRLQAALRDAIRRGRLTPGTRLPSTRALAFDLGLSRGTIVDAYAQLAAEGWITTIAASGTFVNDVTAVQDVAISDGTARLGDEIRTPGEIRHDLRPGRPAQGSFPRGPWLAAVRKVLARAPDVSWNYGHPFGEAELRYELAIYLRRVRGVHADPAHVVVTAGFADGLGRVSSLLPSGRIAVEATGMPTLRSILQRGGRRLAPVPVDHDGAVTDAVTDMEPAPVAMMLTPAHQYPLGASLGAERRHQLLAWARQTDGLIIEDDYDGEFRYDRQPIGALQALDPDRVIYGGTTSKTMAPALRLGWLAAPAAFAERIATTYPSPQAPAVSVIEQLALAELLRSGSYDRHVRRMRLEYRRRRDHLVERVHADAPRSTVHGIAAGLQLVLELPADVTEDDVLAATRSRGIAISALQSGGHHLESRQPPPRGIVVGYANPPAHAFHASIDILIEALRDAGLGPSR